MEKVARCNYSREEEEEEHGSKKVIPLCRFTYNSFTCEIISVLQSKYSLKRITTTNIQTYWDVAQNFLKFLENLLKKKLLLNFRTTQFGINEEIKEKIAHTVERLHNGNFQKEDKDF